MSQSSRHDAQSRTRQRRTSQSGTRQRRKRILRNLRVQALDTRILLAADVAAFPSPNEVDSPPAIESVLQSTSMTEDVNQDGRVSALDALTIINRISRGDRFDRSSPSDRRMDTNADGDVSALDALRVINRMQRDSPSDDSQLPRDRGPRSPVGSPDSPIDGTDEVQSIDGTGNNLVNPELGSTNTEFRRVVESDYADGISEPAGEDRLSAREISNLVFDQQESLPNEQGFSNLLWQWGQFIDHDITATAGGEEDPFDISVPSGDIHFDPLGTGEQSISLTRTPAADGTGVESVRQQNNTITAFLDGSMIYGSDVETAESLRAFEGGRLAVSEGNLLPIGESGFFEAGDERANEQLGLISMQTLWVREHNRIADEISGNDTSLSDEDVFQSARRQVIAELQAITFNEYLPQLLGREAIDRYDGYDASVDPSISNLFATAAFRYGHTALPTELARLNEDGSVIEEGNVALQDAFFNPSEIQTNGIDSILKGLASTSQQEIDTKLVDDVRNFLFGPPGAGGFDLAALNIQRGRDHGLPDYNSARDQMGLDRVESFSDITSDVDVQNRLAAAYENVDQIDAWVGMLAEDQVNGSSLGQLATTVIAEQFMAIRDGDRFWYQNVMSSEQAREVGRTRLSDVIERNTELTTIDPNAFRVEDAQRPDAQRPDGQRPEGPAMRPPETSPPALGGDPMEEEREQEFPLNPREHDRVGRPRRPVGDETTRPADVPDIGVTNSDERVQRQTVQRRDQDSRAVDQAIRQLF